MSQPQRVLFLVLVIVLLAACGGPKPAPVPTRPKAAATVPWVDTLPADGWFGIRAMGRLAPFQSDVITVYQDGRAVYTDENEGRQYDGKLDADAVTRWKRMFVTQAKFMSLQGNYPPGKPLEVDEEEKNSPKSNDAIVYTILYRDGGIVKTVRANKSGAPRELVSILNEFWNLADELKRGPGKE